MQVVEEEQVEGDTSVFRVSSEVGKNAVESPLSDSPMFRVLVMKSREIAAHVR